MAALQFVAIMCSALFAGAALYISLVEHPARMSAGVSVALQEFRPSYRRAAVFQIIMAVVACVSTFALSLFTSQWIWSLGGGLTGLMLPFTVIVIMPTNRMLLDATSPLNESDATEIARPMGKASPDSYHCGNARFHHTVGVFSADTLIRFDFFAVFSFGFRLDLE